MTRGDSPWRALAQLGISAKWEDPRTTWSGCLKRNPRPSGRGVCQKKWGFREIGKVIEMELILPAKSTKSVTESAIYNRW